MTVKHITLFSVLTTVLLASAPARAGEPEQKTTEPLTPFDQGWHFTLAVPAILPSFNGDAGIRGLTSSIDVPADKVLKNLDMAAFFRGEVSKDRFGFMADFIAMNLSGRVEPGGLVKTMDLHFDEIIGEPALRWRVLEGRRGWLDVYAGVRYVNLHQAAELASDAPQIEQASSALVDAVGERLRGAFSESELRDLIQQRLVDRIEAIGDRRPDVPAAPIAEPDPGPIRDRIQEIIDAKKQELIQAIRDGAQQRVDAIKRDLSQQIANTVESKLNTRVARTDDWWDPFIGLRGRLNLGPAWYLTGRFDIGGFDLGSRLAWQAEAALGYQITRNMFVEAGYRALSMDYQGGGLTYDVIAHGVQVTIGVRF